MIFNQDNKYLLLNYNVHLLFRTHRKGKLLDYFDV